MKHFILISCLFIFTFSKVYTQYHTKMEKEGVVEGFVIIDGQKSEGYIQKMGTVRTMDDKTFNAPWQFQNKIKFISKELFEGSEKIKNRYYEKYSPKKIDAYQYDTLFYESVKYADLSDLSFKTIPRK